jgi:eukaryotic-like serine/threonine-protein kinase
VRGKYRILGKVSPGGMGAVYKALHLKFEQLRALKVMSRDLAADAEFVKRFEREAVLMNRPQHPNVVRVDDIDESEDGCPFIVMEFAEE